MVANMASKRAETRDAKEEPDSRWLDPRPCISYKFTNNTHIERQTKLKAYFPVNLLLSRFD